MNTHNDFLDNAVDDEMETEGIENLTADVCLDMQNDTEKMCLSLQNGTCGGGCNAFLQKPDSVFNVKVETIKNALKHFEVNLILYYILIGSPQ